MNNNIFEYNFYQIEIDSTGIGFVLSKKCTTSKTKFLLIDDKKFIRIAEVVNGSIKLIDKFKHAKAQQDTIFEAFCDFKDNNRTYKYKK